MCSDDSAGPVSYTHLDVYKRQGFLKCEASRVGEDTTLSQIIRMVSDAAATKAPIAKIADKVSGVFVPAVIGIAAVSYTHLNQRCIYKKILDSYRFFVLK